MAVLTPTKMLGATTKTMPTVTAEPGCTTTDDALQAISDATGLNGPFLADFLSAMFTHERCGRHLYRSVELRTNNPMLKAKYGEFGKETERHAEILEQLIAQVGGNPQYVSPMARAVEYADTKTLESSFMLEGSVDLMGAETTMLDAVFIAESVDHANWKMLRSLVKLVNAGPLQDAFRAACDEVERQEDEHLTWATDTKSKLTLLQASGSLMRKAGAKGEEMVATIKNWFTDRAGTP